VLRAGFLIGPRGTNLKRIEQEAGGVKLFIRGRGTQKEGKKYPVNQEGMNEDMHVLVQYETDEQAAKAREVCCSGTQGRAQRVASGCEDQARQGRASLALLLPRLRPHLPPSSPSLPPRRRYPLLCVLNRVRIRIPRSPHPLFPVRPQLLTREINSATSHEQWAIEHRAQQLKLLAEINGMACWRVRGGSDGCT